MPIGKRRRQQTKKIHTGRNRTMAKEITKEDVVKFIEGMTVLELSELVKELEEKFGVSAAAPVAMVAAAGPAQAAPAQDRECP